MHILIAEDELYPRLALVRLIEKFDPLFTVEQARDGEEAYRLLAEGSYDLLISDIRMPEMDGLALSRKALDEKRVPNVVLLTGYAEFDYALEALRIGVTDYLLKPLETDKLYAMLERLRPDAAKTQTDPIVQSLLSYVRLHLGSKINIADVCRNHLFLNPAYVSRHYRQVTGETIIAAIGRMRMERAEQLLKQTTLPVSDIAEQCGYSDASVFTQSFRKTYGYTPLELRKR